LGRLKREKLRSFERSFFCFLTAAEERASANAAVNDEDLGNLDAPGNKIQSRRNESEKTAWNAPDERKRKRVAAFAKKNEKNWKKGLAVSRFSVIITLVVGGRKILLNG